jgi:hypothetical protein
VEIFHFYLDSMRKKWGTNFEELVFWIINPDELYQHLRLVELLRQLVQGQRTYFPDLKVDWVGLVNLANYGRVHLGVHRVLLEASLSSSSKCISSEHKHVIDLMIKRTVRMETRTQIKGIDAVR